MGVSVFTSSMSSGNSIATFDIEGAWTRLFLLIPTFTSQSALGIDIAVASNATYFQLAQEIPQTTTAQAWRYVIPATATSGGFVVPLPVSNTQFLRVHTIDSAPTAAVNFSLICSNSF